MTTPKEFTEYRSNDGQGLYVDQHFQESEQVDMPAANPDYFKRPHASHVSRTEWSAVLLLIALVLGLMYSHLEENGRHLAGEWRAEDVRMQAKAEAVTSPD